MGVIVWNILVTFLVYVTGQGSKCFSYRTLSNGAMNIILQGCYVGGNGCCTVGGWRHSRSFLTQEITTSSQPKRRPPHERMFAVLHQGGNHQVCTSCHKTGTRIVIFSENFSFLLFLAYSDKDPMGVNIPTT